MSNIRQEIEELTTGQFGRLVTAMARLQQLDGGQVWLNIAGLHGGFSSQNKGVAPRVLEGVGPNQNWWCSHGIVTFAVWHRLYVLLFEKWLQKCDPDPTNSMPLTLPFWDNGGTANGYSPFSNQTLPAQLTAPQVVDFFGNTIPNPLLNGLSRDPPRRTGRNYKPRSLSEIQARYDSAMTLPDYVDFCQYGRTRQGLESPHDDGHVAVGGDMSSLAYAAFDPIFYMHHCNIERYHVSWQQKNKTVLSPDDGALPIQPFYPLDHPNFLRPWENQKLECPKVSDWINYEIFDYTYSYWPRPVPAPNLSTLRRTRALRIIDFPHPPNTIGADVFVKLPGGETVEAGSFSWFTSDKAMGECEACAKTPFLTFTIDVTNLLLKHNVFFGDESQLKVVLKVEDPQGTLISLPYKYSFDWAQDVPPRILSNLLKEHRDPRHPILHGLRDFLTFHGFAHERKDLLTSLNEFKDFMGKAGLTVAPDLRHEAKGEEKDEHEAFNVRALTHAYKVGLVREPEASRVSLLKKSNGPIHVFVGDVTVELFHKFYKKDIEAAILQGTSSWGQTNRVPKRSQANVIIEWVDESEAGPAGTLANVELIGGQWHLRLDKKVHWTLDPKVQNGFRVDVAISQAVGSLFGLKSSLEKGSLMNPQAIHSHSPPHPDPADLALL